MVIYTIRYTDDDGTHTDAYRVDDTIVNADEHWVMALDRKTRAVVAMYNKDFVVGVRLEEARKAGR